MLYLLSFLPDVMIESMRVHYGCKCLFIRDGDVIDCGKEHMIQNVTKKYLVDYAIDLGVELIAQYNSMVWRSAVCKQLC